MNDDTGYWVLSRNQQEHFDTTVWDWVCNCEHATHRATGNNMCYRSLSEGLFWIWIVTAGIPNPNGQARCLRCAEEHEGIGKLDPFLIEVMEALA